MTMETERQRAAQAAYTIAYRRHRIARGDRTKTAKLLSAAALEVVAADTEAARIASVDAGHFQGART